MFIYVVIFAVLTIATGVFGWFPIHLRWVIIMLLFTAFLALAGRQVTSDEINGKRKRGRWEGILIDSRFKMSLSRLQICLWTILALSAFTVIALDRTIPVLEERITILRPILDTETDVQPEEEPYQPLNIKFPGELLAALGISTASLGMASIIKSNKTETKSRKTVQLVADQKTLAYNKLREAKDGVNEATEVLSKLAEELTRWQAKTKTDPEYQRAQLEIERIEKERTPEAQKALTDAQDALDRATQEVNEIEEAARATKGDVHTNDNINQADWSDMFRSELVNNYRVVDIAKVQMFFFTIVIIFTYGVLIWGLLGDKEAMRLPTVELPAFSASLTGLLGISHAGYLVVKQAGD